MFGRAKLLGVIISVAALVGLGAGTRAEDSTAWQVSKATGEVWVVGTGAQPA